MVFGAEATAEETSGELLNLFPPLICLDFLEENIYNHRDFTAKTPQQYSDRQTHREGPLAEKVPLDPEEGQRRSGGGNAHGPLPVTEGTKEAQALNLGGTTKR